MEIINGAVSYYDGFLQAYHWKTKPVDAFAAAIGKQIRSVSLENDTLYIVMEDDTSVAISDEGQSCCEHRYATCDDDLSQFAGAVLLGAEEKEVSGNSEDDWSEHDIMFVDFITTAGRFQLASHNEHNGYYGGFSLYAR